MCSDDQQRSFTPLVYVDSHCAIVTCSVRNQPDESGTSADVELSAPTLTTHL